MKIKRIIFFGLLLVGLMGSVFNTDQKPFIPATKKVIKNIIFDINNVLLVKDANGKRVPDSEMVAMMHLLKGSGYKIYALSNMSKTSYDRNAQQFDFFKEFDGFVLSSIVGYAKPQAKIYTSLLERYKLNAAECFFIDDCKKNVEGAWHVGIDGVVYQKYSTLKQELKKRHILP